MIQLLPGSAGVFRRSARWAGHLWLPCEWWRSSGLPAVLVDGKACRARCRGGGIRWPPVSLCNGRWCIGCWKDSEWIHCLTHRPGIYLP
eukprot:7849771-Pyramimonas_sp.AAC.1